MRTISPTSVYAFLCCIAFSMVQIHALKNVSYFAFFSLCLWLFLYAASIGARINKIIFIFFWAVLLFFLYQIRFSVSLSSFRFLDFMYFAPIIFVFFCGSLRLEINRIPVYQLLVLSSLLICFMNLTFHLMGYFPAKIVLEPYAGTRWMGGFDGPNEFGQFYSLTLALLLGLRLSGKIKSRTMLLGGITYAIIAWFSFSRGTIASLGVLFTVFIYLNFKEKNKVKIIIAVGIVALILYSTFDGMFANFYEIRSNSTGREAIVQSALDQFYNSPIVGNGYGAFDEYADGDTSTPHSDYLYFLVSGGIVGTLFIVSLYGYVILKSYKLKMYPELLFFITFAAHSMTFNNLVRGRLSIFFWIVLLTFLLSINAKAREEDGSSAYMSYH